MRIDIEVGQRELNYKKVILVISIFIMIIACIYIGIILPKIVDMKASKMQQDESGNMETGFQRPEGELAIVIPEMPNKPGREAEKKEYPIINADGINRIKNIYESEYKRVYLTFDDGPSKTVTTQVLNILDNYNVKATFFVLGSRVELYPEIVKETYDKGHYIANHGYSHIYKNIYGSVDNVIAEYRNTEIVIKNALGMADYYSNVFRFPGGSTGGRYAEMKAKAVTALEANNIAQLDWNSLSRDSEGNFTKEELVQNVINTSIDKNSVVVLMHDAGNKITTYEALPEIIEYFMNNGYVFETLYDVIEEGKNL